MSRINEFPLAVNVCFFFVIRIKLQQREREIMIGLAFQLVACHANSSVKVFLLIYKLDFDQTKEDLRI